MKKGKLLSEVLQGLLVASAVMIGMPHLVFAAEGDLAVSVNQLTTNELTHVPDLINACFYIGGAAFCGSGLLKLKMHADSPAQTPLGQGLGRLGTGAALLALPFIAQSVINSFSIEAGGQAGYTTFTSIN